jgi:Tfp pilus assembly protein PilO|tara:strand:+ start:1853 stop:2515 length:663 start_codon:yes stop_codon:yes gene_type:complete
MDLKNLKIEDLKALVLPYADKKTLIKIGISAGAIIFFLIIYYAVLNPIVNKKKLQLAEMNKMQEETTQFTNDIATKKAKIKKLTPRYEKYSTLFHTRAEVEGLYETLSYYAGVNGLVISKIEKMKINEVSKAAALAKASGKKAKKKKATKKRDVAYYTIPVSFEINGNFLGYIKFKRALSLSNKMLNFDKESIRVIKKDSTGAIRVTGILTIVGLADEYF